MTNILWEIHTNPSRFASTNILWEPTADAATLYYLVVKQGGGAEDGIVEITC